MLIVSGSALGKVFLTVPESLELAFPGGQVERQAHFLTDEQQAAVSKTAGSELRSALVHRHVAHKDGKLLGTAYFDTHRVRTLPETLLIVVDPENRVERIEILTFDEPEDYIPRPLWYDQFDTRPLSDELRLKRSIREVTGATLTARATTDAVRRVLALHQVLPAPEAPTAESPAVESSAADLPKEPVP